jgi:transposase-like protein
MTRSVATCRLEDGFIVKGLRHYKCQSCDARFFDDEAIHRIQTERAMRGLMATAR